MIRGIWLPECGYVPEADQYLKEFGIEYAIVESHGILYADPAPLYGTFAPITSPGGLTCFGRDMESSKQVWSKDLHTTNDHKVQHHKDKQQQEEHP